MATKPTVGTLDPKLLQPFSGKPPTHPVQTADPSSANSKLRAPAKAGMGGVLSAFGNIDGQGEEIDFDPGADLSKTHAALDKLTDLTSTHVALEREETGSLTSESSVREREEDEGSAEKFCGCLEGILPGSVVTFLEETCRYVHNLIVGLLTGTYPETKPRKNSDAESVEERTAIPEEQIPVAINNQLNATIGDQITLWRERVLLDKQLMKELPEYNVRDWFVCRVILVLTVEVGEEIRTRTIFNRVYDKLNRRNFTKDLFSLMPEKNEEYAKLAGFEQGGEVEDFTLTTLSLWKYWPKAYTKEDPFTARVFAYGFDECSMQKVRRIEFTFHSLKTIQNGIERGHLPVELNKEELSFKT